jgi:hypothetical protein
MHGSLRAGNALLNNAALRASAEGLMPVPLIRTADDSIESEARWSRVDIDQPRAASRSISVATLCGHAKYPLIGKA